MFFVTTVLTSSCPRNLVQFSHTSQLYLIKTYFSVHVRLVEFSWPNPVGEIYWPKGVLARYILELSNQDIFWSPVYLVQTYFMVHNVLLRCFGLNPEEEICWGVLPRYILVSHIFKKSHIFQTSLTTYFPAVSISLGSRTDYVFPRNISLFQFVLLKFFIQIV